MTTTNTTTNFAALRAELMRVSRACSARREEIKASTGKGWAETYADPSVQPLVAEENRLYREMEAVSAEIVRANLETFGLEDFSAVGVLLAADGQAKLGQFETRVSELCSLRYSGLAEKFGIECQKASLQIRVEKDGRRIGYVDSDGRFNYEAAPNLRTALGWKIATDGGRERSLQFFDLEKAAREILATIRENGTGEQAFFGPYFEVLKRVFVYEQTTRFGNGYCGAATIIWQAATRDLGQAHEGYAFMH